MQKDRVTRWMRRLAVVLSLMASCGVQATPTCISWMSGQLPQYRYTTQLELAQAVVDHFNSWNHDSSVLTGCDGVNFCYYTWISPDNTPVHSSFAAVCVAYGTSISISIQPVADVEPSGTTDVYANTSSTVYAQVVNTQTNQPQSGVRVKFSIDVVANSGGHDGNHYQMRPKGKLLDCSSGSEVETTVCITQPDGRATVTFHAPIVSGTHNITAECVGPFCTGPASGDINVKVDGLATIPASQFYTFIGATDKHSDNHYLTTGAASVLWSMAVSYQFEQRFKLRGITPPPLNLNDASLIWGGIFDIDGDWDTPHNEHRRGTVIDIRANSNTGAIDPANFDSFMRLAYLYGANAKIHNAGEATQHFHVRLLGRGE